MRLPPALLRLLLLAWLCAAGLAQAAPALQVGSKRFTESYLLGELVTQTLAGQGIAAEHRQGLGNTAILAAALRQGQIDVYPEYTGTIVRELLHRESPADAQAPLERINAWLAPLGLKAGVPLGFNNSYALAMREADAARLGIATISELAARAPALEPGFKLGLSHEFIARADGWPALQRAYGLPQKAGAGLDHGLAYQALASGEVDLIDVYTTDAQLARQPVRVLRDDRGFFPRYDAVLLMRSGVDERPLQRLAGRLPEAAMIRLNAAAELEGRPFAEVARGFLQQAASAPASAAAVADAAPGLTARLLAPDLARLLGQHLALVLASLALAVAVAVPLGIAAHRLPRLAGPVMAGVGLLQTLPSLALLAFLIALVGRIGFVPALLALFVYALLPIVRNTHAGLQAVPDGLRQAALALGLTRGQALRSIELPLALPTLMAGVKTAAVTNVGTATVAAFVGAGGLGERIVAGLAVNDTTLMLAGALPAAALAVVVQAVFDGLERWSRGARPAGVATAQQR
ncbi:glycine betaine ABC transporter substrate-binding protein [Roseateles sp.]|uniref:ABC transporter permease/substrate-binding protein n=1 Tax=Roseateles sp. TaxID=1971397 RepID=UPI002DFFE8DC|nr:glycine betaine ABC transporter substrate-binding protein [Roseateles sp.]HEV6967008.1 glycine betaine ABC transporter substrate-binding protein [Roseateles sp.]